MLIPYYIDFLRGISFTSILSYPVLIISRGISFTSFSPYPILIISQGISFTSFSPYPDSPISQGISSTYHSSIPRLHMSHPVHAPQFLHSHPFYTLSHQPPTASAMSRYVDAHMNFLHHMISTLFQV